MNHIDIINEIRENASEWLEMSENPNDIIIGILAKKLSIAMIEKEVLEKRLKSKYVPR